MTIADRPVVVFVGPSAAGKSSVVRTLQERGVLAVKPTWTDRPARPDEGAGALEHTFVSAREFSELELSGFFAGTATLFGLPYRYGLPPVSTTSSGPLGAVMLRSPLIDRFARIVPTFITYQVEDTLQRTAARLHARGDTADAIAGRLADFDAEVALGRFHALRVFVNDCPLGMLADRIALALVADVGTSTTEGADNSSFGGVFA